MLIFGYIEYFKKNSEQIDIRHYLWYLKNQYIIIFRYILTLGKFTQSNMPKCSPAA